MTTFPHTQKSAWLMCSTGGPPPQPSCPWWGPNNPCNNNPCKHIYPTHFPYIILQRLRHFNLGLKKSSIELDNVMRAYKLEFPAFNGRNTSTILHELKFVSSGSMGIFVQYLYLEDFVANSYHIAWKLTLGVKVEIVAFGLHTIPWLLCCMNERSTHMQ